VACSRSASSAIFAFSPASIRRLVFFVIVRSVYQAERPFSNLTPGPKIRVHFSTGVCQAPTAGRSLVVSSLFTLNGEWQTSRSLGKLKPTMDAAFVRHAGQGSSKLIPNLLR
jgi:hypothetical protein